MLFSSFLDLVLYQRINPIFFEISKVRIHYYGLVYSLGFLFVYFYSKHLLKTYEKRTKELLEILDYILIYSVIGMLIFARLGFVIYNLGYFLKYPLEIFYLWNGGMTFFGGLTGAILLPLLILRKEIKKLGISKIFLLMDIIVIPVSYVLAFGRLANLINSERIGIKYNGFMRIVYPNIRYPRFPIQILEFFKNQFIFIYLSYYINKRDYKPGLVFSLFLIIYGSLRFVLEFFRDAPRFLIFQDGGQFLSLISILTGIILFYLIKTDRIKTKL